jgi:hypothetical protein
VARVSAVIYGNDPSDDEVLAVNQHSENNRQLFRTNYLVA